LNIVQSASSEIITVPSTWKALRVRRRFNLGDNNPDPLDLALTVHVGDEPHDGNVADGLSEEDLLDGEAGDLVHQLDHSQEGLEPQGL